ncbi:hypothetical protein T492DRAFT_864915, partial [Pavlovales sp. CCMP2436]
MRLNVAAGSSIRFEPGESKSVTLVEIAGHKRRLDEVMVRVAAGGFAHAKAPVRPGKPLFLPRQ